MAPDIQQQNLPYQPHNHDLCRDEALHIAQKRCEEQGVRLTTLRRQVLELIWQSHQPLGAYDLLERMAASSNKRVAPPTVYRALEFLQEHGLVHRLASLNAFTGCREFDSHTDCYFFICSQCRIVTEMAADTIATAITQAAAEACFQPEHICVEVLGRCPNCPPTQA